MSISAVINTSALGPRSRQLSSGGQPYSNRAWLLRNVLLPLYTSWCPSLFREVVVVGEYEAGPGYTYVHCPSEYFSCVDALAQRDAGFTALTNKSVEWVMFQHDDHLYDPDNLELADLAVDAVSPSRWTRARSSTPEQLNDGMLGSAWATGHINGHACLLRPSLFQRGFAWTLADKVFQWDESVTQKLQTMGAGLRYEPSIRVFDMEAGAAPWL